MMLDNNCMYCTKNEMLKGLMMYVCDVNGFPLYLFKNQAYRGRSILAFNNHTAKIADMDTEECAKFFLAVQKVTKALTKVFNPGQINIGMYADKVPHLHCHFVPKYEGALDWGGIFQMNPQPELKLNEEEYAEIIEQIKVGLAEIE